MKTPRRQGTKEIAERLADRSAPPESVRQLKKLLEDLAQDSDFETLPEISLVIRQHLEAGTSKGARPAQATPGKPPTGKSPQPRTGYAIGAIVAIIGGLSLVLLVAVFLVTRMLLSPTGLGRTLSLVSGQPPIGPETLTLIATSEVPTQPAQPEATPTQAEATQATPSEATPTASPSPVLPKIEHSILVCVTWQGDQKVGLPGSTIIWQTDQDKSAKEEISISNEDGCVKFPVSVLPNTRLMLRAKPPGDGSNLQIVGHDGNTDGRTPVWEASEEEGDLVLATTLAEETATEYTACFLVAARRTFSGEVLNEEGAGIPGAEVDLWGRASPGDDWDPINKTVTAEPDGTFVLTDTTGLPQVLYRVGVGNPVTNRYVYTTTSASGPDANWVGRRDPQATSVAWLETQTALGSDQLSVPDITFNQELEYVLLEVQEAVIEPEGIVDWRTVSPTSGQEETASNLITLDPSNVDKLQARWEDIELPPGTYTLETWTPENSNARVNYQVLSSGRLLDERVSYQGTRQDRGEVNQWIDFSKTLNPSLVVQLPVSERVTVIVEPSLSTTNREYNLSGDVVFGVGPVRFVKQQ